MLENTSKLQAFKLKGRLYTLTVLQILDADEAVFAKYLDEVITKAPKMFDKAPIVLDFSSSPASAQFSVVCTLLRSRGLIPIAVQGATPSLQASAIASGLAVIGGSSFQDKDIVETVVSSYEKNQNTTKLITAPIRSGQQVVSMSGDLIIIGSVSHGAELLADGNIHVYGPLRGRALAGINGNTHARIFCHALDAELLSIAGYYRLRDELEPPVGSCQIYLQDEQIQVESL